VSEGDDFLGAAWAVLVAAKLNGRDFVFVDECPTNTSLTPLCMPGRGEGSEHVAAFDATGERT
jgi:hypothetical protein